MARQQYHLDPDGSFVINDYDHAKVLSSFFPGIAGLYGIPMWVFYVNRGQGIASFGIESKDKAILEFQPANRAWRLTSIQGFRTFIKVGRSPRYGPKQNFYEPFAHSSVSSFKVSRRMILTSHDLTIEEVNASLGLKVTVNYFTMPEENYAALVRRVTIANTSDKPLSLSMIDGLPVLNPYGLKDSVSKNMSRTAEAWADVRNLKRQAPFYQLKVEVADTPQVTHIHEGNFYFAFDGKGLLDPVVEAAVVFGHACDFLVPEKFLSDAPFRVPKIQQTSNRTPCAMAHAAFVLKAGGSQEITSLTGFAHDLKEANAIAQQAADPRYLAAKAVRNRQIIDGIKDLCFTHSAKPAFDRYAGQTFLDNVLRGGLPISVQTAEGPASFNVYSRKHGDPERDYNFFILAPTHLSQGNGNYRDVNQNRRNDVWFNAHVKETTVVNFLNLVQADGYNPLMVKGTAFAVASPGQADALIKEFGMTDGAETLKGLLVKGFMPGDLLEAVSRFLPDQGDVKKFLARVLRVCRKQEQAEPGEGFWTDHWTYNLDLIESFLGVYPEDLRRLLVDEKVFHFFLNDAYVLPREKRYILTGRGVRQYHSLAEHPAVGGAKDKGYQLRTKNGQGDVYHTTLAVKLLCLLANKAATFDPSGIGVEMEADKPGWYDALNGLPGLLGSSISETFEVKRLGSFLNAAMDQAGLKDHESVSVFVELADFLEGLSPLLSLEQTPLKYWHKANDLKENYRKSVRLGITGEERPVKVNDVKKFCERIMARADAGIAAAQKGPSLFATYFTHEVTQYDILEKPHEEGPHVRPLAFKRHDLPLFLEGFVHAMRTQSSSFEARALYKAVRSSQLFDRKLGMYRVNADLCGENEEIGRARIFPAGWLENGSIWLHMEYKYLLEVLRRGLYREFFNDMATTFVPFMDPARYGRSILENSSFIVSSVHEDKNLHGQGFVARLSGSTAEFVHMWLVMSAGHQPFTLDTKGELTLELRPILPGWMFTLKPDRGFGAGTYAFKFLGTTLVVYHNAGRVDTFGPCAVKPVRSMVKYALSRESRYVRWSSTRLAANPSSSKGACSPEAWPRTSAGARSNAWTLR
ncbi:MAG: hypothetical protein HYZ86_00095 [Candidatus Omnitrophica bacterium]|nr:hypothetical protein [Candidatus Omnitrophota bacterium]